MSQTTRYAALLDFLQSNNIPVSQCNPCDCGCECENSLSPLSGDASFRRYYRLKLDQSIFDKLCKSNQVTCNLKNYPGTVIVMDAPVDTQKNPEFVRINKLLHSAKILVPAIICKDIEQGFMVLEDLGNTLFFDMAVEDERLAFYFKAMVEMMKISCLPQNEQMQQRLDNRRQMFHELHSNDEFIIPTYLNQNPQERYQSIAQLPLFDKAFIDMELNIFTEWLLEKRLNLSLSQQEQNMLTNTFAFLSHELTNQPQVPMHRDYHCRNLMVTPDGCDSSILARLAVIDYQDMVLGPVGYDPASLLFDCYTVLDQDHRERLMQFGFQVMKAAGILDESVEFAVYQRMIKLCALQRHIKVLGIFNRLALRDGKRRYLDDLPLVLNYILENSKDFPEMSDFALFLQQRVACSL